MKLEDKVLKLLKSKIKSFSLYDFREVTEIVAKRANTTISKTVADFLKSEGFKVVEEGIGWKVFPFSK